MLLLRLIFGAVIILGALRIVYPPERECPPDHVCYDQPLSSLEDALVAILILVLAAWLVSRGGSGGQGVGGE